MERLNLQYIDLQYLSVLICPYALLLIRIAYIQLQRFLSDFPTFSSAQFLSAAIGIYSPEQFCEVTIATGNDSKAKTSVREPHRFR